MTSCTVITPINIAVIKYWGKKNFEQNIPLNDSLSATISTKLLNTKTTITLDDNLKTNEFWLNGKLQNEFFESERFKKCEAAILEMANVNRSTIRKYSIKTVNSFPTGAGLASSASGYCALVLALAKIHGVAVDSETNRHRLSEIARLGSGSACRSLFGGWVKWTTNIESGLSYAHQLYPKTVWPTLKLLVLIVDERMKKTGSTPAMIRSAKSSDFLTYRIESLVNQALHEIECAIRKRDFATFARLVIRDSNRLHAICLDTYPPVFYMNDCSFRIVDFVCDFNRISGGENCEKVAYTFDAGPNAFLFVEEENFDLVLGDLLKIFPKPSNLDWSKYLMGLDNYDSSTIDKYLQLKATSSLAADAAAAASCAINDSSENNPQLKMILVTEIGSGPYFETN